MTLRNERTGQVEGLLGVNVEVLRLCTLGMTNYIVSIEYLECQVDG